MLNSRSSKNILSGFLLQFISSLLGLISRRYMVDFLGIEVLGVNSILLNIVNLLGLLELGYGIVFTYTFYKPLSNKNFSDLKGIQNYHRKVYIYISIFSFIVGLLLLFPLTLTVGNFNNPTIIMAYLLLVFDLSISYLFNYMITIYHSDHNRYKINLFNMLISSIITILQIFILVFTSSFIYFIIVKVLTNIFSYLFLRYMYYKDYPYFKNNDNEIDYSTKSKIKENVKSISIAKISTYIIYSIDSFFILYFVNAISVGIYSNYLVIVNLSKNLINNLFSSFIGKFGQDVSKGISSPFEVFSFIYFLNFLISFIFSILMLILFNPFIHLWLGEENFLLSKIIVYFFVFNFFNDTSKYSVEFFKNAYGFYSPYKNYKYWIVLESAVNFLATIFFTYSLKLGILGVILGTTISSIISTYIIPYHLFKYIINKPFHLFLMQRFKYLVIFILSSNILILFNYDAYLINYHGLIIGFISGLLYIFLFISLFFIGDNNLKKMILLLKKYIRNIS